MSVSRNFFSVQNDYHGIGTQHPGDQQDRRTTAQAADSAGAKSRGHVWRAGEASAAAVSEPCTRTAHPASVACA
jgi:hypothetical protein